MNSTKSTLASAAQHRKSNSQISGHAVPDRHGRDPIMAGEKNSKLVVDFDDNRLLGVLFGAYESNLARLEKTLDISAISRGNRLVLTGPAEHCAIAREALSVLYERIKTGQPISHGDVDGAVRMAGQTMEQNVERDGTEKAADKKGNKRADRTDALDAGDRLDEAERMKQNMPDKTERVNHGGQDNADRHNAGRTGRAGRHNGGHDNHHHNNNVGMTDKTHPQNRTPSRSDRPDKPDSPTSIKTRRRTIMARSPAQAAYMEALCRDELVVGIGPAGTGKTYLAVAVAAAMLTEGRIDRIILSRPAVEAGERLGFLPGDMRDKIDPYLRPLYDALYDMLPGPQVMRSIESGEIEIAPLAFMRGRTLANSFIILDEAQNATPVQMKMFLTRMGEGSHMVITGDPSQIDLPFGVKSGLRDAMDILPGIHGMTIIEFTAQDVVRHDMVTRIIRAYQERERQAGDNTLLAAEKPAQNNKRRDK